jgi:hypothetical protein
MMRIISASTARIEAVQLAACDQGVEVSGGLGMVVGAEEEPRFSASGHGSLRIFAGIVVHAQPTVVEEAPQSELLSNGVAEGLADEATCLTAQVILGVHPGEELVDERSEHGLSILEASRGRQFAPGLIELVQLAHAQESLATDGETGDGGFPKTSASMRPTGHFAGRHVAIIDSVTAEQRIVDGVGVGLDETV